MIDTPASELSRPSPEIILYWAMNIASAGSICTRMIVSTKLRRPRKRNREIANAARVANTMQTRSAIPTTIKDILSDSQNGVSVVTVR